MRLFVKDFGRVGGAVVIAKDLLEAEAVWRKTLPPLDPANTDHGNEIRHASTAHDWEQHEIRSGIVVELVGE